MSIEGDCPECGHYTNEMTKDGVCIDCYCQPNYQTEKGMDEKIFLDIYHHYPPLQTRNLPPAVYAAWVRGQWLYSKEQKTNRHTGLNDD